MVTALRSGPPPIPPSQPGRAADALRLPEFARGQVRMEGVAGLGRVTPPAPEGPEAAARLTATENPGGSRQGRPARPGSRLDIRG